MLNMVSSDNVKLVASIGANIVAKLPALAGTIIILPIIRDTVGLSSYSTMLSMLALGSTCSIVFGGIGAFGRRELSFAYAEGSHDKEANVFITTCVCTVSAFLVVTAVVWVLILYSYDDVSLLPIALLPIVAAMLNTFDNMRSSYNEHYVTALWQFSLQTAVYTAVFVYGIPSADIFFASSILVIPFVAASLFTGVTLIVDRNYLLGGRVVNLRRAIIASANFAIADGAIFAALNYSVYWLGYRSSSEDAGSYGTLVRLFQTLLSPAMLIVVPLSSYVSIKWTKLPCVNRQKLLNAILIAGALYGCCVGSVIFFGGQFYVEKMIRIINVTHNWHFAAIAILGGAITMYKMSSMLVYAIVDARSLSLGTAAATLFSFISAGVFSIWLAPTYSVDLFCVLVGVLVLAWSIFSIARSSPIVLRN